jgi:hypothetical protein
MTNLKWIYNKAFTANLILVRACVRVRACLCACVHACASIYDALRLQALMVEIVGRVGLSVYPYTTPELH